ncbi:MAG: hypothetical protein GF313_11055, partial [Caldithrix sp.]|nr:hypothetical protein [Caldithrix sp.]
MRCIYLAFVVFFLFSCGQARQVRAVNHPDSLHIIESSYAQFPHGERQMGHHYSDRFYAYASHYNDSSIAIYIPSAAAFGDSIHFVIYFHGWRNHIRKSLTDFKLLKQIYNSRVNAIFIFPQGPNNAADSFAGKMEDAGGFQNMMRHVMGYLKEKGILSTDAVMGSLVLAGHSGAYRRIAFILNRGGG